MIDSILSYEAHKQNTIMVWYDTNTVIQQNWKNIGYDTVCIYVSVCVNKNIWAHKGKFFKVAMCCDEDQVVLLSFVWLEKRIVSEKKIYLEKKWWYEKWKDIFL